MWPFNSNEGRLLGEGRPVTSASLESWLPDLSSDGKKLAFAARRAGKWELWQKSLDDGKETLLANDGLLRSANWSPDGKRILLSNEGEDGNTLVSDGGGAEEKRLSFHPIAIA